MYIYNGILSSLKKEGNPAICENMNEPGGYYVNLRWQIQKVLCPDCGIPPDRTGATYGCKNSEELYYKLEQGLFTQWWRSPEWKWRVFFILSSRVGGKGSLGGSAALFCAAGGAGSLGGMRWVRDFSHPSGLPRGGGQLVSFWPVGLTKGFSLLLGRGSRSEL